MHAHPLRADVAKRAKLELADVVRRYGAAFRASHRLSGAQLRALRAIQSCRTSALSGLLQQCSHCGAQQYRYHSCRNRHCPKCQTLATQRWLAARRAELLPVPYFHLVFTLPHELNPLTQGNPRALYGLLFAAVSKTLVEFGANPRWLGGQIAASLLLHTWSQTLIHHIHLHCLVAGGALDADGHWIRAKRGFLFPIQALSGVFRGKFLAVLRTWLAQGRLKLAGSTAVLAQRRAQYTFLAALYAKDWVVYAKHTMAGPQQALDYLSRYTYKSAISNERLRTVEHDQVRFAYRDRAHGNRRKIMQLPAQQFLERFTLHVLPRGFVRVRHIGLLANRHKRALLGQAAAALQVPAPQPPPVESAHAFCLRALHLDITLCPACRIGRLVLVGSILAPHRQRAPP